MSSQPASQLPESDALAACQNVLRYRFKDQDLLIRCLTHASAARTRLESNERMEFLGDAILGAAVCEELFHRFPESSEGELTRIKSVVVSRATCARLIRQLKLDDVLVLGKGITTSSSVPNSVLATAFEAIIGGIYLDGGYEAACSFIGWVLDEDISNAAESTIGVNYKSLFQQRMQKVLGETPVYTVMDERGPDHSKCFQVTAVVGDREFIPAWGPSKKVAEQRAARNALAQLDGESLPLQKNSDGASCETSVQQDDSSEESSPQD
ncbi:Ribonuclease 3 [Thalassoglobus neptunius]|uniref:Ribonuclease 3 n=1 Tax=Thalassoglobus neptunius TaxID=1938619 RepID=A0A5C5X6K1_9PLAN|nr:ribonuclease III [Thalassoglobus neptunius]TWT58747.1 Ribonuclease 3 [Thalassoglobus neptunius]